jgi:hypothetical protein
MPKARIARVERVLCRCEDLERDGLTIGTAQDPDGVGRTWGMLRAGIVAWCDFIS